MASKYFYDTIRGLFGKLSQNQVDGIEAILLACDELPDLRQRAYVLGTIFHESGHTMQPVEEYGRGAGRDYGKKLKMGNGPGKRIPYISPNKIYYGRGHVQVTWFENYEALTRFAKLNGYVWDFLNNPELMLQVKPSLWATIYFMRKGYFTGASLDKYFIGAKADWVNARKIINGLDQAQRIATYAQTFFNALVEPKNNIKA
jgi:hypothetical protein